MTHQLDDFLKTFTPADQAKIQTRARALIEDELLMALPQVPMHDSCPVQPKMAAVDEDFEADGNAAKANPFAVLAALKGKKS